MNEAAKAEQRSAPDINETIRALMASGAGAHDPLVRARDFYLTLFEEFPALIWRAGLDAKCNYFNKTWLAFTGKTLEQELGDGWAQGVHPDDFDRCVQTYLDSFAKRQAFQMEYRILRHDGEYRWLTDFGRPFYDLDGDFAGYIGSCYDITDRKRDEQALRESEERYRLLIEHTPDTIFIVLEDRFVYMNRAGLKFFGVSSLEEIQQKPVSEVLPEHHERIRAAMHELHNTSKAYIRLEVNYHHGDAPGMFIEVTGTPITYNNQQAMQVIVRDITERKRAETIMHDLAYRDSLTQLLNRKAFQDDLKRRMPKLNEQSGKLAIFFIDLDNFKLVNDHFGHDVGDAVLIEVANRLRKVVRIEDTLARLGGDEFILLSQVSSRADAAIIIERMQKAFTSPIDFQGISYPVSMSIGISLYPDDDTEPEQLVQKADYAMYMIKNCGKDGYGFYQAKG